MAQALPIFLAAFRMMLRSRGVIYAMVSSPVMIAAFGLMRDLDFGFGGHTIDFFDFAVPGMAVFLAAIPLQDTMTAVASSFKARGTLRRLAVTPVAPGTVVAAQVVAYVALGVFAAGLTLAVGALMGARIAWTANLFWLVPLLMIAILTALSTAFAIAGLTPNPQTANVATGMLSLPLFALTGAVLPIEALPEPLHAIVPYGMPYTSLIEAIRGIALTGSGIIEYTEQVIVGLLWLVGLFLLAARAYRFQTG